MKQSADEKSHRDSPSSKTASQGVNEIDGNVRNETVSRESVLQDSPLNRRRPWWYIAGMALVSLWLLAATLWGIKAPFIWGHYGYHAGFHGCNARTLLRHHIWTPAQYAGRSLPPAKVYYLHHPILMHPYLALGFALFGQHEWVIRSVPVTFTFLALFALAWVVRRLYGPGPALAAAAVFVLLPQNLIFSHLIDHETPGLFYSILATGTFVLWMERGLWRHGLVSLAAAGLAGLTDWPPYPIFFFMALYGLGRIMALLPGRNLLRSIFPFGLTGLLVQVLPALAVFHEFEKRLKLPKELCLGLALVVVLLITIGLSSALAHGDHTKPQTKPPDPHKTPSLWKRPESGLAAMGRLALWSLVILAAIGFHVWYTKHVGAWDDMTKAFKHRSGGAVGEKFLDHYKNGILYLMFTKPVVWMGLAWLTILPFRLLGHERISGRQAIPLAFAAAQVLHNFKFPNEIDMHNYRAYYFVGFFTFVAADWAWFIGQSSRRVLTGLQGLITRWKRARITHIPTWTQALPTILILGSLLTWQAKAAWKPFRKSRPMGGTLTFKHYRSHRHEIRFFGQVNKETSPDTFVLIHRSFHPRFEDLYYLDRDYGKTGSIPGDRRAAERRARSLYWNPYRPRHRTAWWVKLLPWRLRNKLRPHPWKMPPFHRPVALVADLRNKKALAAFAKLWKNHPVVIDHPFGLVFYHEKGKRLRVYRITGKPVTGLARYLNWRSLKIVFQRDRGLERWYAKRFERLASRPIPPRRPKTSNQTRPKARVHRKGPTMAHVLQWLSDFLQR